MEFDPSNKADVDRLFSLTQRGAFSGYRPDQIGAELGGIENSPGGVSNDEMWPISLVSFVKGNIYNDRFYALPDDTSLPINNDDNKMPGWYIGGDDTNCDRELSTNTLVFTTQSGLTNDYVYYIEQLVYVPGANITTLSPSALFNPTTYANPYIAYRFESADGVDTSSWVTKEFTAAPSNTDAVQRLWIMTTTRTQAFLRVRFGFKTNGTQASGSYALGTIKWTWCEEPDSYDVTLPFMRTGWSPSASTTGYNTKLFCDSLAYGEAKWTSPSVGIILAISVYTNDTITAGTIKFYPRVASTSLTDPLCTLTGAGGGGDTKASDVRDIGGSIYDIDPLDRVDVLADTNGTFASAGAAAYVGTLQLRMVLDNKPSTGGNVFTPASA